MIVDAHCHAGEGDALTMPWTTAAPLDAYLRRARAAGIDVTVVLPMGGGDYGVANERLSRIVSAGGGRLIGFAGVHARRDRGRIGDMIETAVRRYGFRGIKVHTHDAPISREVCEAARRWRIPALVDVAGRGHLVDMFAPQFPDVDFIIPHLGSFADDWRAHQQVVDQLVRLPNVYADTSGVRRFDYLVQAVRRAGPGKLIFGSDGPWLHPDLELRKIKLLGLPAPAEARILGETMLRLLDRNRAPAKIKKMILDKRAVPVIH